MTTNKGFGPYASALAFLQAGALIGGCDRAPDLGAEAASNSATVVTERPIPPAPAKKAIEGPERLILAFGDSLYAGYGLKRGESLPDRLQASLRDRGIDATVVNAGVSGDTTSAGRRRLAFTLDRQTRKPDLVILGLGGNDLLRQIPPAETRANMIAMLDELRRRDIPVILTGMLVPPNLGPDFAASFNGIWPDMAKRYDAGLDPFILAGVVGNRALMLPDGVHPNANGVARIATRLTPLVADRIATLD